MTDDLNPLRPLTATEQADFKLLDGTWTEAALAWKTFRAQSSGPAWLYEKILERQIELERCRHVEINYFPASMTHRCAVCDKTVSSVQSKIGRFV